VIEIHRSVMVAEPACVVRVRREEPALASFHPLLLAVCRRTRRFPGGDPIELGLGIRAAALGAADLMAENTPAHPINRPRPRGRRRQMPSAPPVAGCARCLR
jgi:hypothetical protein